MRQGTTRHVNAMPLADADELMARYIPWALQKIHADAQSVVDDAQSVVDAAAEQLAALQIDQEAVDAVDDEPELLDE